MLQDIEGPGYLSAEWRRADVYSVREPDLDLTLG